MEYLAHKREDGENQTVQEHCRNTAHYASECLEDVGLKNVAYLAGLMHDAGKYQSQFQQYLLKGNAEKERGSVIHTFQGCRMLLERFHHHEEGITEEDITCELLAYAVGAHHGLFDCIDDRRKSGFTHRINSEKMVYFEAKEQFLKECATEKEIDELFESANKELKPIYIEFCNLVKNSSVKKEQEYEEIQFYIGLLARLILSSVIEGDRRDTAEFMNDTVYPDYQKDKKAFWISYLKYAEESLKKFTVNTPVQVARHEISEECRNAAEDKPGIYKLNVPTGSGKTLSAMRFALAHAAKWGKERIIYTAPLLTILDQNAKEIREFVGDDRIVLEHYSSLLQIDENEEKLNKKELLEETWNVPVIITSMAQLLNTIFLGKTSSIRRFHALSNSVIIIDEVQTVPSKMLTLFNLSVNFLSNICNTTFVLCSATQPEFGMADHPILGLGKNIVPYNEDIWKPFHRTDIKIAGSRKLEDIPDFIEQQFYKMDNVLVICNKKVEAEYLFKNVFNKNIYCLHLSASMCQEHRKAVLEKAEKALLESKKGGRKFLMVATQVIEAGVNISFDCVIRLTAGMDSVVQSAGRCNRNGEIPNPMPVYMIDCSNENLNHLREIRDGKKATCRLLEDFQRSPDRFANDLSSEQSIQRYYEILYKNMNKGYQDYKIDDDSLFSMLSDNEKYADEDCEDVKKYYLKQAFKKAGKMFQVYDESGVEVIVPYGEGESLIHELQEMNNSDLLYGMKDWLARAKPYTITLYQYQIDKIENKGICEINGIYVLEKYYYDPGLGFTMNGRELEFLDI